MIVTMILGTLNHFLYDWSGKNCHRSFSLLSRICLGAHDCFFFPFLLLSLIEYIISQAGQGLASSGSRLFACLVWYIFHHRAFSMATAAPSGRSFVLIDILLYYLGVIITYSLSAHTEAVPWHFHTHDLFMAVGSTLLLFFLPAFHRRYHCLSVLNLILMHLHYRHDYNQIHLLLLHFYTNRLTSDIHNISKAYPSSTDPSRRF